MAASRWTPFVVWIAAAFLALATLVWSSGEDMFLGLMLLLVLGGWGLLGTFGIASFVQAARTRSAIPHTSIARLDHACLLRPRAGL